jgi:hypothetical protein
VVYISDDGVHSGSWWGGELRRGSGVAATEAREVGEFRRIASSGSIDVAVRCGQPVAISVTADDNLLPYLETEVRDGVLQVEMKSGSYSFEVQPRVEVRVPSLEGLAIEGSAGATIDGLDQPSLELSIAGSGEIEAAGKVERLFVSVAGSGGVGLFDLASQEAAVSISGSGKVEVRAERSLQATVSGSGDVFYRGSPRVIANVSGSGSVRGR